jgi:DNA-binding response OmpR family regulator
MNGPDGVTDGMRILVADDDASVRGVLVDFLQEWGMEVVACVDGSSAWQEMQKEDPPRLVILDWTMPGISGLELCSRLRSRQDRRFTYIIFLTGRSATRDMVEGLAAGADDYLSKPFEETELSARIQVGVRVVRMWEQMLELEKNRVLSQTAGAMAHEIAQPLSIIMGQAQLLQMRGPGGKAEQRRYASIYQAGQRVDDILRQMEAARSHIVKPYLDDGEIIDFDAAQDQDII